MPSAEKGECCIEIIDCHLIPQTVNTSTLAYDTLYGAIKAVLLKLKGVLQAAELIYKVGTGDFGLEYRYSLKKRGIESQQETLPAHGFKMRLN